MPTDPAQFVEEAVALLDDDTLDVDEKLLLVDGFMQSLPDNGDLWAVRAELLESVGEEAGALAAFEKSVALDPGLHTSWHWIGLLKKRGRKDLDGAITAFAKALEAGGPPAKTRNEIAVTYALAGRVDDALRTWDTALTDDPEWGVLYANALKAALMIGREDLARAYFERGLRAQRFEENVALLWCDHLVREGRKKPARDAYAQAAAAAPDNARIRYYYGVQLRETGDEKRAQAELLEAISLAVAQGDKLTESVARQAHFRLASPKSWKRLVKAQELSASTETKPAKLEKDLREAVEILDPIIAANPELWEPVMMRGISYRRLGDSVGARTDFERILRIIPEQPNALMNLALLSRDEKSLEEALALARRAVISANDRDPLILLNAGFVFLDGGSCDEAREMHRRARLLLPVEVLRGEPDPLEPLLMEIAARCTGR